MPHEVFIYQRLPIFVDWTQSGGTHESLVAAVEQTFFGALKAVLPPESQVVVVSDAGFKGPFFQTVRKLG